MSKYPFHNVLACVWNAEQRGGEVDLESQTQAVWNTDRHLLLPTTQTRAKIQSGLTAESSSRLNRKMYKCRLV